MDNDNANANANANTVPIIGADGVFSGKWREGLDPAIRDNPVLVATKDIKSLASQLVNAEGMVGKKIEALIPQNATPEQITGFLRKFLKAPDKAELLTDIKKPVDYPANIPWSDDLTKGFANTAIELGLLPHQATKLFTWYNETVKAMVAAADAKETGINAEAERQLKATHQNKYQEFVDKANAVLARYGGKVGDVAVKRYANDPVIITLLGNIASVLSEDLIRAPAGTTVSATAEAQTKLNKIMDDKKHAYHNAKDPAHQDALDEVRKLYEILTPKQG